MPSTSSQTFDYAAARRAGFSDEQIAAHLAAKRASGVNVVVDRAEVDSARAGADPPMMTAEANPGAQFLASLRGRALETLPAAGGFAGGLLGAAGGPVGAIGGAAAGGALGEGVREAAMGEPLSPGAIAGRGGLEGGLQAVGGAAAKGAAKLARPLMRGALGIGKPIAGKVKIGAKLYDDPVEIALAEKIKANEPGALTASALRKESGKALGSMVSKQTAAGKELSTREVTKYAREMLLDDALPVAEKKKVFNELVAFYREKGTKMSPALTQRVKRYYGGIYKGWDRGTDPLADPTRGAMAREMTRGAREALGPEIGTEARRYAALKGTQKAVEGAARKPEPAWEIQKPGTIPVLRGLVGDRSRNSGIAIALAGPKWRRFLQQFPRAAVWLGRQGMYSDEPDVTAQ